MYINTFRAHINPVHKVTHYTNVAVKDFRLKDKGKYLRLNLSSMTH